MGEMDYAYAVARIRAVETGLLSKVDFDQLLLARDITECMRLLIDRGYAQDKQPAEETDYEFILTSELESAWALVMEIAPHPEIFHGLLYKHDFHNFKTVLKGMSKTLEYEGYLLTPNTVSPTLMRQAVVDANFDLLPLFMQNAAKSAYEALCNSDDSRAAEVLLDKASLLALQTSAKETNIPYFMRLSDILCDCSNLRAALRMAYQNCSLDFSGHVLSPCGTLYMKELASAVASGTSAVLDFIQRSSYSASLEASASSMWEMEKWWDGYILSHLQSAKLKAFGPDPLFAYLFAKETEIKNIRIILSGKMGNLPDESIRERLRQLYV